MSCSIAKTFDNANKPVFTNKETGEPIFENDGRIINFIRNVSGNIDNRINSIIVGIQEAINDKAFAEEIIKHTVKVINESYSNPENKPFNEWLEGLDNGNKIKAVLRQIMLLRNARIGDTAAKQKIDIVKSYTSANARAKMGLGVANGVIRVYLDNPNDNFSNILNKVSSNQIREFEKNVYTRLDDSDKANAIRQADETYKEVKQRYTEAKVNGTLTKEVKEELLKAINDRRLAIIDFAETIKNDTVFNNQTALAKELYFDKDSYFDYVMSFGSVAKIANLKDSSIEDVSLEEIFEEEEMSDVDQTTRTWDTSTARTFDSTIDTDVQLLFNKYMLLNTVVPLGTTAENYEYDYNPVRDEETGAVQTYGYSKIAKILSAVGQYDTVDNWIKSIYDFAANNSYYKGLTALANDLHNNPVLANKIFSSLSGYVSSKIIVDINGGIISVDRSNKNADIHTSFIFGMSNAVMKNATARFNMDNLYPVIDKFNEYFKDDDSEDIRKEIAKGLLKSDNIQDLADIVTTFRKALAYLNPNITEQTIYNAIIYKGDYYDNILNLKNAIENLYTSTSEYVDIYSKELVRHQRKVDDWLRSDRKSPFPKLNLDDVKTKYNVPLRNLVYTPVVELSKLLAHRGDINIELNTPNAAGNLSTDVLNNNYISNLLNQISYGTEDDTDAGLKKLMDAVKDKPQYKYSPFYFGVYDNNGNEIAPGLFKRDELGNVTINPNAKKLISISLFDGIRNMEDGTSVLQRAIGEGDYFFTQLMVFQQGSKFATEVNLPFSTGGYFLRTPSDAPKNSVLSTVKYDSSTAFSFSQDWNDSFHNRIYNNLIPTDFNKFQDKDLLNVKPNHQLVNKVSPMELYNLTQGKFNIKNKKKLNTGNYLVATENSDVVLEVKVVKNKAYVVNISTNKVDALTNLTNIIMNDSSVSKELDEIKYKYYINRISAVGVNRNFFRDINDNKTADGLAIEKINVDFNSPIVMAIRQVVHNEINNYITQLNNIVKEENGELVINISKEGLFKGYHYNGDVVKELEDGSIVPTGSIFEFISLPDFADFNFNEEIKELLGIKNLIIKKGDKYVINQDSLIYQYYKNGEFVVDSFDNIDSSSFNDMLKRFMLANEVNLNQQYDKYKYLIEEFDITRDQLRDYSLNYIVALNNYDDIFEGDSKFYGGARKLLKRAKEIQASGKSYAAIDMSDGFYSDIHDLVRDGKVEQIFAKYNGEIKPITLSDGSILTMRNGFIGATIAGVTKTKGLDKRIAGELYTIYDANIPENATEEEKAELRKKNWIKANQIAGGYIGKSTKTNDAQSYITIEEFIRRRHADGTIKDYEDIIPMLLDPETNIKSLNDLEKVVGRIQVGKNFYFDKQFDPRTNTVYPRQIKNAEFVLIPAVIKGTHLEKLYNLMKRHGIDQINTSETSKAANKEHIRLWDNDGNYNEDAFEKAMASSVKPTENYYYRYLYKQQDGHDHMLDAENKAGVQIMKKLVDNATPATMSYVTKFFEYYTANIRNSYRDLLYELGWTVDEQGVIKDVENGTINFDKFYEKARRGGQRLGLDSNFMQLITPNEFGELTIPLFASPFSKKFENISQAIFNNVITRQTLPGWHAPQVSSVGVDTTIYDKDGEPKTLQYHKAEYKLSEKVLNDERYKSIIEQGKDIEAFLDSISEEDYKELLDNKDIVVVSEPYAEIMLPRYSKLIPADYPLEKLAEQGLDITIGYRIPTEGKQSVSRFKIVGILPEVYGSTVIVPDEWVTQSGSDFDVDSIYGIQYEMRRDYSKPFVTKDGTKYDYTLVKEELDTDTTEEGYRRRYNKYVSEIIGRRIHYKKPKFEESYAKTLETLKELNPNNTDLDNLTKLDKGVKATKEDIKKLVASTPKEVLDGLKEAINKTPANKQGKVTEYNKAVVASKYLESLKDDKLNDLLNSYKNLAKAIKLRSLVIKNINEVNGVSIYDMINNVYEQSIKDSVKDYNSHVEQVAKENKLVSFEEFKTKDIIDQQTSAASNNVLIKTMNDIMEHKDTREENYSRSNFDDAVDAVKYWDKITGRSSVKESAYNPFDQIKFVENAVAGQALKAFSVTRDNFLSCCNFIKASVSNNPIYVSYSTDKLSDAQAAYGEDVKARDNDVLVTHRRLGHSNNNKNVEGMLITPYSSQTTAHILDVMKEGAIINENLFTFGSFKTLVDLGVDYKTAVGFLYLPTISAIVDYNSKKDSMYYSEFGDIYNKVENDIKKKLGIKQETSIEKTKEFEEYVDKYCVVERDNKGNITKFSLIYSEKDFKHRLTGQMDGVEAHIFDYLVLSEFKRLKALTTKIEQLARHTNSDKFGAKQTIYETELKLQGIAELYADNDIVIDNTETYIGNSNDFTKEQLFDIIKNLPEAQQEEIYEAYNNDSNVKINLPHKPFMMALYPGFNKYDIDNSNIDIEHSAYPTMAAFVKYATATSYTINRQLFTIESSIVPTIAQRINKIIGRNLTVQEYEALKDRYKLGIFRDMPFLNVPQVIDKYGFIESVEGADAEIIEYERHRIFGYNLYNPRRLNISNIHNPTAEDKSVFMELTPAEKVDFIKTNFDNAGIFNFIETRYANASSTGEKSNSARLRFNPNAENVENLLIAFREAFNNKNPLIRLAAIDLIKYTYLVEGNAFKYGSISRIIPIDILGEEKYNMGVGLSTELNSSFYKQNKYTVIDKFIENYFRADSSKLKTYNLSTKNNKDILGRFNRFTFNNMRIVHNKSIETIFGEDINKFAVPFVKVKVDTNRTILFKVVKSDDITAFIPLNSLESYEIDGISVNEENNKYNDFEYYRRTFNDFAQQGVYTVVKDGKNVPNKDGLITIAAEYGDSNYIPKGFKIEYEYIHRDTSIEAIENMDSSGKQKLIKDIETVTKSEDIRPTISSNNPNFKQYVGPSGVVTEVNGELVRIAPNGYKISQAINNAITVYVSQKSKSINIDNYIDSIRNKKTQGIIFTQSELNVIKEACETGVNRINTYQVTRIIHPVEGEVQSTEDENRYSVTRLIDDFMSDPTRTLSEQFTTTTGGQILAKVEDVISSIEFSIKRDARLGNSLALDITKELTANRVLMEKQKRITQEEYGSRVLYAAADYFQTLANEIKYNLSNFTSSTGDVFDTSSDEFYKHIAQNREDYYRLVKYVLDAKTFGDRFEDIVNIDIETLDEVDKETIKRIIDIVNGIKNNTKINAIIEKLFENYLATNYSLNPLVRNGIIDVRTTFQDTDSLDLFFSDTQELNNKQVQLILKKVNEEVYAAKYNGEIEAKEFAKQFDELIAKGANLDNIITNDGYLKGAHNDEFIPAYTAIQDKVNDLYITNPYSREYFEALDELEEFKMKNIHRPYVIEYYKDKQRIRKEILSSNNVIRLYGKYKRLQTELGEIAHSNMTEELANRKQAIISSISEIVNPTSSMSEEEMHAVNKLNKIIKAERELNEKYFDTNAKHQFTATLSNYLKIVKTYDENHPNDTLEDKLRNEHYKEAFEWIKQNTRYQLNKESASQIYDAFNKLKDKSNAAKVDVRKVVLERVKIDGAYDQYGNIDYTKLSEESIRIIKAQEVRKIGGDYGTTFSFDKLVSNSKSSGTIYTNEFYKEVFGIDGVKDKNADKEQLINKINKIISPFIIKDGVYNAGKVDTVKLVETLDEATLQELKEAYEALDNMVSQFEGSDRSKIVGENVIFKIDEAEFKEQQLAAQNLSEDKKAIWDSIFVNTGIYNLNSKEVNDIRANYYMFGYMESVDDKYVDKERTEAKKFIEDNVMYEPTYQYIEAKNVAKKNGTFKKWFDNNHIFNPYTKKWQPISIWTTLTVNPNSNLSREFIYNPTYENTNRKIKEEYKNKKYNEAASDKDFSYILGDTATSNNNYNTDTGEYTANYSKEDLALMELINNVLHKYAIHYEAVSAAKAGRLPYHVKSTNDIVTDVVKGTLTFLGLNKGTNSANFTDNVEYSNDFDPEQKHIKIPFIKGMEAIKPFQYENGKPDYLSEADYEKAKKDYNDYVKETQRKNKEIVELNQNRNWRDILVKHIQDSVEYRAKQKAKLNTYLLIEDLKHNKAYERTYFRGKLREDRSKSSFGKKGYKRFVQENTIKLVQQFHRRMFFDQYHKPSKYRPYANILQNIASSKFMMMNIIGGINNVNIGMIGIFAEAMAGDYVGHKDMMKAQMEWVSNSSAIISSIYGGNPNNKTVGIINRFDVVNLDELHEVVDGGESKAAKTIESIRNHMYAPQSIGEHHMHNIVLLSMIKSHKVYIDKITGLPTFGNLRDYTNNKEFEAILEVAKGDETIKRKLQDYITTTRNNVENQAKYDALQADFIYEFVSKNLTFEQKKEYIEKRDAIVEEAKKEFDKKDSIEDSMEMVDGSLVIKEGSLLTPEIIGSFRNRVIQTNKKIHGVYDKMGAARIEQEWWGSLVMQYHKHLYPGIMKRYRRKGYFNEIRGTFEKGSYWSVLDFVVGMFKNNINYIVEEQDRDGVTMLQTVQRAAQNFIANSAHLKTYWNILPEYERNNIKRAMGDAVGVVLAFMAATLIYAGFDDDDIKKDDFLATSIHLVDRFNSENASYFPTSAISESKKLWSSPIAASGTITDLYKILDLSFSAMFDEKYKSDYTTGRYKGENKIKVHILRNVPIYRTFNRFDDMDKSNSYYKLGNNSFSLSTSKKLANKINPD